MSGEGKDDQIRSQLIQNHIDEMVYWVDDGDRDNKYDAIKTVLADCSGANIIRKLKIFNKPLASKTTKKGDFSYVEEKNVGYRHEAKVEAGVAVSVETGVSKLLAKTMGKYDSKVEAHLSTSYQFNYDSKTTTTCEYHMKNDMNSCAYVYQAYVEAHMPNPDGSTEVLSWDGYPFMHDEPIKFKQEEKMYPSQVFTDAQLKQIADITYKSVDLGWETKHELANLCGHIAGFPEESYKKLKDIFTQSKRKHWESADACKRALKVIHKLV